MTIRIQPDVRQAQCELIDPSLAGVGHCRGELSEQLADSQVPLRGLGNLVLIVDHPDLGYAGRFRKRVQGSLAGREIRILPRDLRSHGRDTPRGKLDDVVRVRDLELLVDRDVERYPIVIESPTTEYRGP